MKVSINYSFPAGELVDEGAIQVDVFKCPAWEDLIDGLTDRPIYVHFPLVLGRGAVINSEHNAPADLDFITRLKEKTATPFVNTHFAAMSADYPEIPHGSLAPEHIEIVVQNAIAQIRTLQAIYGAENVTVENIPLSDERILTLCALPEVISRIVEETGCCFLLDISHARLSARKLGMDEKAYLSALPVHRIREIHVTGIITIDEAIIAKLEALGIDSGFFHRKLGHEADHVAFTESDWEMFAWVMGHIHRGEWATPDIVAFEYGGVGGFWEKVADKETIRQQVPRMYDIVNDRHPEAL
jgi:uncharacterized protein (UPF0276 family)